MFPTLLQLSSTSPFLLCWLASLPGWWNVPQVKSFPFQSPRMGFLIHKSPTGRYERPNRFSCYNDKHIILFLLKNISILCGWKKKKDIPFRLLCGTIQEFPNLDQYWTNIAPYSHPIFPLARDWWNHDTWPNNARSWVDLRPLTPNDLRLANKFRNRAFFFNFMMRKLRHLSEKECQEAPRSRHVLHCFVLLRRAVAFAVRGNIWGIIRTINYFWFCKYERIVVRLYRPHTARLHRPYTSHTHHMPHNEDIQTTYRPQTCHILTIFQPPLYRP